MKLFTAILFLASIGSALWAAERSAALLEQADQSLQDVSALIARN